MSEAALRLQLQGCACTLGPSRPQAGASLACEVLPECVLAHPQYTSPGLGKCASRAGANLHPVCRLVRHSHCSCRLPLVCPGLDCCLLCAVPSRFYNKGRSSPLPPRPLLSLSSPSLLSFSFRSLVRTRPDLDSSDRRPRVFRPPTHQHVLQGLHPGQRCRRREGRPPGLWCRRR